MTDWTTPVDFSVGEDPPASALNKLVDAVEELQDAVDATDWQSITAASGFTAGTPAPQSRVEGGRVFLQGRFTGTVGTTAKQVGTLASGHRPGQAVLVGGMGAGVTLVRVDIGTDGKITAQVASGTTGALVLDGITFAAATS